MDIKIELNQYEGIMLWKAGETKLNKFFKEIADFLNEQDLYSKKMSRDDFELYIRKKLINTGHEEIIEFSKEENFKIIEKLFASLTRTNGFNGGKCVSDVMRESIYYFLFCLVIV